MWRKEVVPKPSPETVAERERRIARKLRKGASADGRGKSWAEILARIFLVDGWLCSGCGKPMRLRSTIDAAPLSTKILRAFPSCGPPVRLAAGR